MSSGTADAKDTVENNNATEPAAEEKKKLTLDVKVQQPSACQRHVTVSIAREDIDRYLSEAFSELRPKAEVPGFRHGRAPRKLVESRFKDQVVEQVKGGLLMDALSQINEDHSFTAISEPEFDFNAVTVPDEGPLTFEFNLEVRPEFDTPQWKGLKLERPVHTYSEAEVEQHLKQLLLRFGEATTTDGPVEADDVVVADLTFRHEGQVISQARSMNLAVKSTLSFSDGKLENFDKLISGAKVGDTRNAKVKVTADAETEQYRGQEIDVEFDVKSINRTELPELNRAFLDRIGGFESEQEVHDAVKQELDRQMTYHQQRRIRQQITGILTASANWELPPAMLRRQARRELDRAVLELKSAGFSDEVIQAHKNDLRQNSAASTSRALKEHFILERIAEDEKIEAQPSDYDDEVKLIAEQSDESPRRVRARLEKRGLMDTLRNQIIERKAIELITQHAEFKEIPFDPKANNNDNTAAVDLAICGGQEEEEIPEAKHAGPSEALPEQKDHR